MNEAICTIKTGSFNRSTYFEAEAPFTFEIQNKNLQAIQQQDYVLKVNVKGILAPAGTSNQIIQKLNKDIVSVLLNPATKEQLISQGFEIIASSPEYLAKQLALQTPKWAKLVKDSGARVE